MKLSRSQKQALLSQVVEGNLTSLVRFKQEKEKPFIYLVNCCQLLPAGRTNTSDIRPNDRISDIRVIRTYQGDRANDIDLLPNMSRLQYEQWKSDTQKGGSLVVSMLRTRYVQNSIPHEA